MPKQNGADMLKIGKLTDYAMLIMSQMAHQPELVLSAPSLADRLHLSTPTVSKILKILAEDELVTSLRGADGGYRLARPAHTITLAQVIAAMEGEVALTACCDSNAYCAIDSMCTLRDNWRKINGFVRELLGRLTLTDMITPLSLKGLLDVQ